MSVFDDIDSIFVGAFGEPANYTPLSGGTTVVSAIIEEAGATLVSTGEVDVVSRSPFADFREADISNGSEGDLLSARGKVWAFVGDSLPDGRGMVRWMLELRA